MRKHLRRRFDTIFNIFVEVITQHVVLKPSKYRETSDNNKRGNQRDFKRIFDIFMAKAEQSKRLAWILFVFFANM